MEKQSSNKIGLQRATYIQVVAGYHREVAMNRQVIKKNLHTTRWCKKSYIGEDDKEFKDALAEQDINAELYTQAANSLDVDLLDLGFFQAIQSFNDAVCQKKRRRIDTCS